WTVIQRRYNGQENFFRTWDEYKRGFGNISAEFWFGNEKIHQLTNQKSYRLRIEMKTWTGLKYAVEYENFRLSDEEDGYRLTVGGFVGRDNFISTTPEPIESDSSSVFENNHNNQKFSTKDRDNDGRKYDNCAVHYQGAWWFNACFKSHLNGIYKHYKKSFKKQTKMLYMNEFDDIFNRDGLIWDGIDEHISLKETIMMIRSND
ncbi:hypothetical protein HELRODRAFT_86942, partial [Helobdella robusta]|uniref:Fibrinogen C-terminal domain-containing protein n=1 Tax=Helobdella robusta TaxID=6412 RepID=T1G6J6_HELRO